MGSSTCTRTTKASLGRCAHVKGWSVNAKVCIPMDSPASGGACADQINALFLSSSSPVSGWEMFAIKDR